MSSSSSSRKDPGWTYGSLPDPKNSNNIQCNFCGRIFKGGITRFKQHLVGGFRNAVICSKCPEHVKEEIRDYMRKKQEVKEQLNAIPHFDAIAEEEELYGAEQPNIVGCKRNISGSTSGEGSSAASTMQATSSKQIGPINLYFRKEPTGVVQQRRGKEPKVVDEARKKLRENAIQKFCRWMYDAGLPFNAVNYDSLGPAIEAIGQYGPGMKPPSYHEVRVKYLKKELEHTNAILKSWEEDQAKYGCSLMADGWTDRKHRSLINFLVNSPKGTKFMESVDASAYSHTGEKLFELLDTYVQRVGEKNVIQVITDSASAYKLAGSFLEAKYPHLFWTPCAAHCIDLMFEDIFKLPNLKKTYERAVMINGYIYNRSPVLEMLRDFIGRRDMVRPAKTRFATAFLTLKRFQVEKPNLRKMFTSERWTKSKYAREAQGKLVASIILMPSFWKHILYILKIAGPLVKVLRLVDGEKKPPMGYIYEAMDRAKEAIAASFSDVEKYEKIFEIIDARWDIQLHRPLHAAGYFLNPEFFYSNPSIEQDKEVMGGLFKCIERLTPEIQVQDKIAEEISIYKKAEGFFGIPMAVRQRTTRAPGNEH